MSKKLRLLAVSALAATMLTATAGASNFDSCADMLKTVGLFQGTEQGYDLDRAPTRAEAATMLVRLLGKEDEAKALTYTAPFTDLKGWEAPYVQYLYDNKMTNGSTATTFSPSDTCSAQMYTTFLLRALGYSDTTGDFTYDGALDFGKETGLVDDVNCDEENFLRDHVAAMSLTALYTSPKDSESRLLEQLLEQGAIDSAQTAQLTEFFDNIDEVNALNTKFNTDRAEMTMDLEYGVKMDGQDAMSCRMPMTIQLDAGDGRDYAKIKAAMDGKIDMTIDPAAMGTEGEKETQSVPFKAYITDGVMYMNMEDTKIKYPLPVDEMNGILKMSAEMQDTTLVSTVKSITKSGDTYTLIINAPAYNKLVDQVMDEVMAAMKVAMSSQGLSDEEAALVKTIIDGMHFTMEFHNMSEKLTVTDGKLNALEADADLTFTISVDEALATLLGGSSMKLSMDMDMVMKANISKTGDEVTITFPDDLSTYVNAEEAMSPDEQKK